MSYVQGTVVRVSALFTDEETDEPYAPEEIVLTIKDGNGDYEERTLSDAAVLPDGDATGLYYSLVDTSPAFGTWEYQFASIDDNGVVGRKTMTVRKRLEAA